MIPETYLLVRQREGWLLADATVARLPAIDRHDRHAAEWRLRAESCRRLVAHLLVQRRPLRIVEAGCGNGWLSHRLAAIPGSDVTGFDINTRELEQARRVFAGAQNLRFVEHDIEAAVLPVDAPDVIVAASVLQYLPRPAPVIARWMLTLAPGGSVHLIDSPLYEHSALASAQSRSERHYAALGVPQMSRDYHHHSWSVLDGVDYDVLHDPRSSSSRWRRRLRRPVPPFPWIRIAKDALP